MRSRHVSFAAEFAFMVGLAFSASRPAMAEPYYSASAGTNGGFFQPPFSNMEQNVSSSYWYSQPGFPQNIKTAEAIAVARPGQVGVNAHAVSNYPTANQFESISHSAFASAQVALDDLIIVSESDPTQIGTVQGSFSVELSGSLGQNAVATGGTFNATGRARVQFNAELRFPTDFVGDPGVNAYALAGALDKSTTSSAPAAISSGFEFGQFLLENGFDGHELFSTAIHTLPVGRPFGAALLISVDAIVDGRAGGPPAASEFRYAEGAAGFANTLRFPLNIDVFSLPPGYTVHSVSGHIVSNRFSVPEPSTMPLLACGIGALIVHHRRRIGGLTALGKGGA